ncbi:MazG nucleotide pyrophosphohydrolase domain-containing protein [Psychromicrobium sp. YIM B11713]|uniref:MazG nucleotide pyrophosphohydrolase domain-containing protein n=1 Tax=Psychromicrobium sp. YIM B11713 TaxID=3145233 RepID=UPI00374F861A
MSLEFDRLVEVIGQLREYCPWMAELTHESLIRYLIEESYELVEAIEDAHPAAEVRGELGDVLLQVVLHARLAEEAGEFSITEVISGLTEKMVRRNPHVFRADGSLQSSFPATVDEIVATWNQVKSAEKPERGRFEGIPISLPALALAQKSLHRAGADEERKQGAGLASEELEQAELELGERLLDVLRGTPMLDAERALRLAVRRFQKNSDD